MTVNDITIEQLAQIIKKTIQQELTKQKDKPEQTYFTYDELSDYLSMSKAKIEKLKREGKIPFIQIEGNIRFHKKQIDLWALHSGHKQSFTKRDIEKYSNIINN